MKSLRLVVVVAAVFVSATAQADIYRWDNGEVIPGTEGIEPGPGVQLDHRELEYAKLLFVDLTDARLDLSNLSFAQLFGSTLTQANLSGAVVTGADFNFTTWRGFTEAQLHSTASYQARNLTGIRLGANDLTGWDFSGQDLTRADFDWGGFGFSPSILVDVSFADAIIVGVGLHGVTARGFTKYQLYSTASYQANNLQSIGLGGNDLSGWDLSGQDLSGAILERSTMTNANLGGSNLNNARLDASELTNANLSWANLTDANLASSTLTNTNLNGAVVTGADFQDTTSRGFTQPQLASTANYQSNDLQRINLGRNDLTGWDFSGQDLSGAILERSAMTNTNLSGSNLNNARLAESDLRGAVGWSGAGLLRNTLEPDGILQGLVLDASFLVIRDYDGVPDPAPEVWLTPHPPIQITLERNMTVLEDGGLVLEFDSDRWDSLISFAPNIPIQLDGALQLTFAPDVDILSQVGRTIRIFDWTGVSPTGTFSIASLYPWDTSELYTTGNVTLLLPGDTNGDHTVDLEDLNAVRNNFGGTGDGDTNGDGVVDLIDLNNVRNFFGASTPQAVPEPSSLAIAAVGLGLLFLARKPFRKPIKTPQQH